MFLSKYLLTLERWVVSRGKEISGFLGARMQKEEIFYPKLSEFRLIKESGKQGLLN